MKPSNIGVNPSLVAAGGCAVGAVGERGFGSVAMAPLYSCEAAATNAAPQYHQNKGKRNIEPISNGLKVIDEGSFGDRITGQYKHGGEGEEGGDPEGCSGYSQALTLAEGQVKGSHQHHVKETVEGDIHPLR